MSQAAERPPRVQTLAEIAAELDAERRAAPAAREPGGGQRSVFDAVASIGERIARTADRSGAFDALASIGEPVVPPRTPVTVRFTGRASFADPSVIAAARANIEPLLTAVEQRLADRDLDEYTVGQLERYRDTARHELYELDEADPVIVNQCVAKLAELVLPTGDWFAELPGVLEAAGVAPELAEATAEDLARAAELAVRTGGQSDADAARTADELGAVVDDLSNDVEVAGAEPGPDAGRRLVVLLKKAGSGVEKVGAVGGGVTLIFGVVKLVLGLFGVHLPFP